MPKYFSKPWRMGGFSLIEVLIATAIVSIGLAGLALLLLASVQGTAAARQRTAAVLHAESLGAAVTLVPDADLGSASPEGAAGRCDGPAECAPDPFLAVSSAAWYGQLHSALPSPSASFCTETDAFACGELAPGIRLDWLEPLEPGGRDAMVLRWGSP